MSTKLFFAVVAAINAFFGLAFLILPDDLMGAHGAILNPAGVLLGRVLGASLLGSAMVFWGLRNQSREAMLPALYGGIVYNVIDVVVGLFAVTGGILNAKGWALVIVHAALAAGFCYFTFAQRK